jgi:aminoglycoside phosphotransferase (APT) family kinase protein
VEIPSVLYLGPVENFEVLVITPIAGRPRFDASTLTRRRVEAAGQIFSLRGPTTTISEHLGFQVDDAGWDRRRIAVLSVTERTADAPVPSGLVHGDFAPWNVIDDGRRVGLIDWEYSRPDGLPFWDLWHFAVLTAVSVGSDRMRRSILRAAGGEGRLAEAIARYAEASGVPARLAPDVLLVYLVRQGATVLEQARSGATDARRGLEPWTRLLDEIIDARA